MQESLRIEVASRHGGRVDLALYTILETCKLNAVDPSAYLAAAIVAADRNEVLLRWRFATDAK